MSPSELSVWMFFLELRSPVFSVFEFPPAEAEIPLGHGILCPDTVFVDFDQVRYISRDDRREIFASLLSRCR